MITMGRDIIDGWRDRQGGLAWLAESIDEAIEHARMHGQEEAEVPEEYGYCPDCWKCDECERLDDAKEEGRGEMREEMEEAEEAWEGERDRLRIENADLHERIEELVLGDYEEAPDREETQKGGG